ncbi:hypothetical protein ACFIQG_21575 [Comamonas odontotermitis]|uniref:hypothetical protein n=1 Tax=Comamonas odontotermitis TaxID=379895 RepID=UPI00366EB956
MKFPYTGWVLTPSFTPKQVVFKEDANSWFGDWHVTEKGKRYSTECIHAAKEAAIEAGHQSLKQQQAALDKKQINIHKRRAALEKAAEETKP